MKQTLPCSAAVRRPGLTRRDCVMALGLAAGASRVRAATPSPPPELAADLPGARLQGSGRLRFMGLRVYEARLWAGASAVGAQWAGVPKALEMVYSRNLKGLQIAERSLDEMRRQTEPAPETAQRWLAAMKELFPDVKEGDRITGLNIPGQGARFFYNGALRGEVRDPEFARLFFGIWLAPGTSEPALREALLGAARATP